MLISDINISTYDNQRFVVNTTDGRHILMNKNTIDLLNILRREQSLSEACMCFNQSMTLSLTVEQFTELLRNKLGGYGILIDDQPKANKAPERNNYLKVRVNIIHSRFAGLLSTPFTYFFTPALFYSLLCGMLLASAIILNIFFQTKQAQTYINSPLLWLLVCLTILVHELGHIAACRRFGIKHGAIGVGIYTFIPVAFADITNIWQASRNKRIMANLGGIFCEYLYAFSLLIIYMTSANQTFLLAYVIIASKAIFQLNPFVRLDGYWVLSDLTYTPNLLAKAKAALSKAFSNDKACDTIKLGNLHSKYIFLITYAILNYALLILYILLVWSTEKNTIIRFPGIMAGLLDKLIKFDLGLSDLKGAYIMATLFYYLLLQNLFNYILKPLYIKYKESFRISF